jgi:hypothetical protein
MKPHPLTSFAAGSPAKISASPVPAPESTDRDLGSGPSTRGSFAFFDRASSSWKTSQRSLLGGWTAFSETLPRAGTMRSGRLFERRMSERPTDETDSSCWPTPTASEYGSCVGGSMGRDGQPVRPSLHTMARQWPTPQAHDACGAKTPEQIEAMRARAPKRKGGGAPGISNLNEAVLWPTPTASMGTDGNANRGGARQGELLLLGMARAVSSREWPTPCAADSDRASGTFARGNPTLDDAARDLWPTPTATDAKASGAAGYSTESGRHPGVTLTDATVRGAMSTNSRPAPTRSPNGLVLSPRFVEAMQGFPDGWTCQCARVVSEPKGSK